MDAQIDDSILYENWFHGNSLVYTGLKLQNLKAERFKEDVEILVYYATHQTENPDINKIDLTHLSEKLIGCGSEQNVYYLNDKYVYKINTRFSGFMSRMFSVDFDAKIRNRHIFQKKVFPITLSNSKEKSKNIFIQEKMLPINTTTVEEKEKAIRYIHRLMSSSFWNEIYFKTLNDPKDKRIDNWAYDENGWLWGIDLK